MFDMIGPIVPLKAWLKTGHFVYDTYGSLDSIIANLIKVMSLVIRVSMSLISTN